MGKIAMVTTERSGVNHDEIFINLRGLKIYFHRFEDLIFSGRLSITGS